MVAAVAVACSDASPTPLLGSRPRNIDVKHLAIDLRFDFSRKAASGTAAITLAPLSPANRVALDAGMLKITSVALANGTPLTFTYDGKDRNDGLVIALDRTYPAGKNLTITIAYETGWENVADPNNLGGSDGNGLRYFGPTTTEPLKRRQIWSGGLPQSSRYWFPGYDAPDDLRTTELTATVPQPLMAISNGELVATTANADSTRTYHWKMNIPYANHLTSIVVGEYVDVQQEHAGIALHSFGYPDETDAVRASAVRLPDMVRYFAEVTGVPYPYGSYSQLFVQDNGWGTAGATTSILTENMVDDSATHADYFYLWDGLEAEALAHQWFGVHLTAREWKDQWLNRAFAHHLDGLYTEHKNGREEFLLWYHQGDRNTYMADWNGGNRHPVASRSDSNAVAFASDAYPYSRGALVLNLMRDEVGDDVWRKSIKRYVQSNGGGTVTTENLRAAVEAESGTKLDWFFEQWVYKMGHPIFDVSKQYDAGRQQLTLTVRQTQRPDSASKYPRAAHFQGALDITLDNAVQRVRLLPQAENVFTFSMPKAPLLVGFDHEGAWIKELNFEKSLSELRYQAANDRDVLGQIWAMAQLFAAVNKEGTSAADRADVYETLRQVILSNGHWRVRWAAVARLQGLLTPANADTPLRLDEATAKTVLTVIQRRDSSWVRAQAFLLLGLTRDAQYAPLYRGALRDVSHVVGYAAATALGQSKSAGAFDALTTLMSVPLWKGENVLSGLNGLMSLGDPRAAMVGVATLADSTTRRWTLAVTRWDFRLAAAQLLAALGKGELGYPIVARRFQQSLAEGDVNDMFSNLLLMATLGDKRGEAAVAMLRERFKGDANALAAVTTLEAQLKEAITRGSRKP